MKCIGFYILFALAHAALGQSYTSYFTGNIVDTLVSGLEGGVCMMGGSSEHDEAMKWFLQQCHGGDVLVLRASGSNGYNSYLYSQLGIKVNSVETIVCHNTSASYEAYLHRKINQAEAIWFAGGDQWDYVSFWRNSPIDSLINIAISSRKIVIGGTSAGMAILGQYYFNARNGTVTSSAALSNPYTSRVTIDSASFFHVPFMDNVITDTHYDNPDRRGRHVVFLARILIDWGKEAKGIACDEYTAVCIDSDGIARIYGDYPADEDNAWFIQINCELDSIAPEQCASGQPLTWNRDESAVKVYMVKGTSGGTNTFDLNDWSKGTGGKWQHWFVNNGSLSSSDADRIRCQSTSAGPSFGSNAQQLLLYPNPYHSGSLTFDYPGLQPELICIYDLQGTLIHLINDPTPDRTILDLELSSPGLFIFHCIEGSKIITGKLATY